MFRTCNKRRPRMTATFGIFLSMLICHAHAGDIEKAEYDKGFGAKDAAVRASRSPKKVAEFAGELLESAKLVREDQPYQAYLFNKSYEIGMLFPEGIPFAVEAMDQLGKAQPPLKGAADANLLNAMQRRYQTSGGPQRISAASAYIDQALQIADSLAAEGKYDEAVIICDKAKLALAASATRHNDVLERALMFKEEQTVAKRIAALKAALKTTPHDAVVAGELVRLLTLDTDTPDQALPYVDATGDAKLKKIVALAVKDVVTLTDTDALELADWYRGQTSKAGKLASCTAWSRAKLCYQHFLDAHPKLDADRLNATRAMKDAEVALAKIPRVFPEVATSVKHRSSATPAVNSGATDLLQPGSVWSNINGWSLTIRSREGDRFHASFVVGQNNRQIVGTVKDGQLSWLAKDVIAITGDQGGDNVGKLNGHQLDFIWSNPSGSRGTSFTLFLTTPSPVVPPPAVSANVSGVPPAAVPAAPPSTTSAADVAAYLKQMEIDLDANGTSNGNPRRAYVFHRPISTDEWPTLLAVIKDATFVQFTGSSGTNDAVSKVATLAKLETLKLGNQPVTDAGISILRNHPTLRAVDLGATRVSGACIADLASIPNLTFLNLGLTSVRGPVLKPLRQSSTLQTLNIGRNHLTDQDVADLAGHPTIIELMLGGTTVTGACAETLVKIPLLRTVVLDNTAFDDSGVLRLSQTLDVQGIDLSNTAVTRASIAALPRFKNLESLCLNGYRFAFSETDMINISACMNLVHLELTGADLSGSQLEYVSRLQNLVILRLDLGKGSDAGIAHLRNLQSLRIVFLPTTGITDESLRTLQILPSLKNINLGGNTSITQAAVDALKRNRPDVQLVGVPVAGTSAPTAAVKQHAGQPSAATAPGKTPLKPGKSIFDQ